jgi:hypothetical protein
MTQTEPPKDNPRIHLLLVSAQPTPNLTPVLDPSLRPERVVLLVSPDMVKRADWLEAVLRPRGVGVTRWPIADAWDLEPIQYRVLELLDAEAEAVAAGAMALNVTGGTKPMALAAFDAFREYGLPIYYIHPERDRLIWMHPSRRPALDLANRLRLDDVLAAHGARLISRVDSAVPASLRRLTDALVSENVRNEQSLATLNWLANAAEGSLVTPALDRRQMQDADLSALIRRFADAGLLQIDGERLRFPDEAARFFVNGGWLEAHCYGLLRGLRGELAQIQDLARSVELIRETDRGDAVPNELDCACLAENRLYIMECKTRRWGKGDAYGPGADALYRLDTLKPLLGGLQARALLVSYRALPPNVLRRASDLRIGVCAGSRLPELGAVLRDWISPPSLRWRPGPG